MSILFAFLGIMACIACGAGGAWGMRLWIARMQKIAEREDPRDTQIRDLQSRLKLTLADCSKAREAESAALGKLATIEEKIALCEERAARAQQQYETCKDVLKKEIAGKNDLREMMAATERQLETLKSRTREMERELDTQRSGAELLDPALTGTATDDDDEPEPFPDLDTPAVGDDSPSLIQSLTGELERWRQHCRVLGDELKRNRNAPPPGPPDELTEIRGIGSVIARKLHEAGIWHYCELAELRGEALRQAGALIPDIERRMRRDGWVEQAQQLHYDKYRKPLRQVLEKGGGAPPGG